MSGEVARRADAAEYTAEPMPAEALRGPSVRLLNATPDPLGSVAALCAMYTGRVVRSLALITDEERRSAFEDMMSTELNGPLEAVTFHFLIEGVDRSFTHQAVRGRSAFYAQESLRFAVPEEDWLDRTTMPPSLAGSTGSEPLGAERDNQEYMRNVWDEAIANAEQAYKHLVRFGMPAEEARGIVPHALQTRYHWVCSLRELLHVAGLRTCTQAQFHWRQVMAEVARELREYEGPLEELSDTDRGSYAKHGDNWQFALIASHIRPVCYQKGTCGFMAKFDRGCTIRERVEANAAAGRASSEWANEAWLSTGHIAAINPAEWACDPGAART